MLISNRVIELLGVGDGNGDGGDENGGAGDGLVMAGTGFVGRLSAVGTGTMVLVT